MRLVQLFLGGKLDIYSVCFLSDVDIELSARLYRWTVAEVNACEFRSRSRFQPAFQPLYRGR